MNLLYFRDIRQVERNSTISTKNAVINERNQREIIVKLIASN